MLGIREREEKTQMSWKQTEDILGSIKMTILTWANHIVVYMRQKSCVSEEKQR